MPKLNQIVALLKGKKTKAAEALTAAYHLLQKPDSFNGLIRTYQPREEDGETQPEERKVAQSKLSDVVKTVTTELLEMFNLVATQDWANCEARADVKVDGVTLFASVPVTYLMFLEKQLVDLRTFIGKLPTLEATEEWEFKQEQDCFVSRPTKTNRTKKVPRNHVLSAATDKHPAQVQMYHEDIVVGTWTNTKFSGAIPVRQRNEMLERVEKALSAVKMAREEANGLEVKTQNVAGPLLGYVLGKV